MVEHLRLYTEYEEKQPMLATKVFCAHNAGQYLPEDEQSNKQKSNMQQQSKTETYLFQTEPNIIDRGASAASASGP
jgi:hypothetical protein